ncbi:MAG: class I SAM-dependent methyltransferase [Bifidobacteriaceae bacterium]|jgi:SAM-dependent methyltransferase|nr:class I SAM-dependent methyltransferase [Bifidobacteriaceae bacterium]
MPNRWNHNTHYHRLVLGAVPMGARTALDAGAGDGLLAAELRGIVPHVTAIDLNPGVVERSRRSVTDVEWIVGDIMTHPLSQANLVASIAMVHHLPDLTAGLRRLKALTAPGGALVVVGLARSAGPVDFAMDAVGALQHRAIAGRRGFWQHTAPKTQVFPHTYRQVKRIASAELAGMRWRRLPLFRYVITWRAPGP